MLSYFGLKEFLRKLEIKCEAQEIRIKKLEASFRCQQNALNMMNKEIDSLYRLYERGENDGK